jgi:hypothetical protein
MNLKFKAAEFSRDIEEIIYMHDVKYIDAVVIWCEKNNFEIEYAAELVKKDNVTLVNIEAEAKELNYIKKSDTLPI